MKLLDWTMEHADKRDQMVGPHDLAWALEYAGKSLGEAPDDGEWGNTYGIKVRWRDLDYYVNVNPGAGSWEMWTCYAAPNSTPVAFLYYKDSEQYPASGEHPMYVAHEPVWDRGWLAMLREAEVVES